MVLSIRTGMALLAISALALGCSRHPKPAPPFAASGVDDPTTKGGLIEPVHAEQDDADDEPRAFLVLSGDVVDACPAVRDAKAPRGEEAMQWMYVLRSVASCVKGAQPGTLVLHGPSRPQVMLKSVLSNLGLAEGRVALTQVAGQPSCDEDCAPAQLRVEIGLDRAAVAVTSL